MHTHRMSAPLAALVAAFTLVPLIANAGGRSEERRERICSGIALLEEVLDCREQLIEIASLYLRSIEELPAGSFLPELPDYVHPEVKRWINRNPAYQPPNNDGLEAFLAGVAAEPSCSFPDKRWVVEGNLQYGVASATFTADCAGFPREIPTLVRDRFLIEDGLIKEVEVIFLLIDP